MGTYRLDVTATNLADLVRAAGGWLFDRSMAGWDVHAVVTGACDPRPLTILGVHPGPRDPDDDATETVAAVALAASAGALGADPELRDAVLTAMKRGIGDVLVWGSAWPEGIERGVDVVEHELSAAARAFKGHAMAALGLAEPIAATEVFRGRARVPAAYSELAPAAATSLAQR